MTFSQLVMNPCSRAILKKNSFHQVALLYFQAGLARFGQGGLNHGLNRGFNSPVQKRFWTPRVGKSVQNSRKCSKLVKHIF